MPTTVRLTDEEQEKIRKKCIDINKLLISKEKTPMRESELVHLILEKTITCVKVDKEGGIYIDV